MASGRFDVQSAHVGHQVDQRHAIRARTHAEAPCAEVFAAHQHLLEMHVGGHQTVDQHGVEGVRVFVRGRWQLQGAQVQAPGRVAAARQRAFEIGRLQGEVGLAALGIAVDGEVREARVVEAQCADAETAQLPRHSAGVVPAHQRLGGLRVDRVHAAAEDHTPAFRVDHGNRRANADRAGANAFVANMKPAVRLAVADGNGDVGIEKLQRRREAALLVGGLAERRRQGQPQAQEFALQVQLHGAVGDGKDVEHGVEVEGAVGDAEVVDAEQPVGVGGGGGAGEREPHCFRIADDGHLHRRPEEFAAYRLAAQSGRILEGDALIHRLEAQTEVGEVEHRVAEAHVEPHVARTQRTAAERHDQLGGKGHVAGAVPVVGEKRHGLPHRRRAGEREQPLDGGGAFERQVDAFAAPRHAHGDVLEVHAEGMRSAGKPHFVVDDFHDAIDAARRRPVLVVVDAGVRDGRRHFQAAQRQAVAFAHMAVVHDASILECASGDGIEQPLAQVRGETQRQVVARRGHRHAVHRAVRGNAHFELAFGTRQRDARAGNAAVAHGRETIAAHSDVARRKREQQLAAALLVWPLGVDVAWEPQLEIPPFDAEAKGALVAA